MHKRVEIIRKETIISDEEEAAELLRRFSDMDGTDFGLGRVFPRGTLLKCVGTAYFGRIAIVELTMKPDSDNEYKIMLLPEQSDDDLVSAYIKVENAELYEPPATTTRDAVRTRSRKMELDE
jgi:hypothetical protein